ncbi:unnamed protein product [Brachionus calyciflorus]|uniref:DDE-1 domain-containing protein n=1 Tax=Brachionus calyciflorus TaxID=104777 RepID=A0A813UBB0_9BILA|nr:unnamed protein product [Brachionus calyciflorus]
MHARKFVVENNVENFSCSNETSIYLDAPRNYTYAKKGSKRIVSQTSGSQRVRISVAFSFAADGTKLPPLVLIPRKTPLKDFVPPTNVIVCYKPSGNFDTNAIIDLLIRVFVPHILRKNLNNPVIFLDRATCHFNDQSNQQLTTQSESTESEEDISMTIDEVEESDKCLESKSDDENILYSINTDNF